VTALLNRQGRGEVPQPAPPRDEAQDSAILRKPIQESSSRIATAREKTLKEAIDVQKRVSRILPADLLSPPQFRDHEMRIFWATSTNRGKQ
jgi:hypothetical protein